MTFSQLIGAAI